MAEALILDAEALDALARPSSRGALTSRAAAILQVAHDRRALVRVPAPVLTEVCRGAQYDAPIHRLLNRPGIGVVELTRGAAERAGHLLARLKLSSAHAVDALVVATALEFDTALIATGDPKDLRRLAAPYPHVGVMAL